MAVTDFIRGAAGLFAASEAIDLYRNRDDLANRGSQNIRFPIDLKTAYIHMQFSKYVRRSITDQPFYNPENSIRLPIPKELTDTVSVNYTTDELGPGIGAAVDALAGTSLDFSSREGVFNTFGSLQTQSTTLFAGIGAEALRQIAGGTQIANNFRSGFSALSGLTINSFQTILFKAPNFKKHRFSWRLIPKNEEESRDIETILSLFKYHMLPGISASGGVFFSYPEILKIKLFPKDEYLYKFKPCVVDSVSVNYAPNGPSFYRSSGAPTAVDFSVNLQEIEIWTKEDYIRNNLGNFGNRRAQEQTVRLEQQARPFAGE